MVQGDLASDRTKQEKEAPMDIFKMNGRGWHWALAVVLAVIAVALFAPLVAMLALTRVPVRCPCMRCCV